MIKKGFTLIEIIAVLAILALAAIVIANSLSSSLAGRKVKNFEAYIEKIESSACAFIELSEARRQGVFGSIGTLDNITSKSTCIENGAAGCIIRIKDIIEIGLIDYDLVNPMAEPNNELNDYANEQIKITWNDSGEKNCRVVDEEKFKTE